MLIATFAFGAFCIFVCVRIETLNAYCGSLPNHEWRDGTPASGPVTWRDGPNTSEAMWRKFRLAREHPEYPDYTTRPLTESERQQMQRDISRGRANNELRDFVSSFGLLQYLAIPALIVFSIIGFTDHTRIRWAFVLPVFAAVLCVWRVFSLAYFPSLEW
jgi:hypothetical protein